MATNQHLLDGAWAEQIAMEYLQKVGYTMLHQNWRYKRAEIDLVCEWEGKLILVEVKYRKSNQQGEPEEAVGDKKMRMLQEAAEGYMVQYPQFEEVIFDIISITGPKENAQLVHFKDAFFPFN